MDWSLLGCGAGGHVTFAPDDAALRERLSATVREGTAWRCLRCGTFVPGPPTVTGPVTAVPRVRRDKEVRSALILRVFAVERFLRAILFAALAIGVWRFSVSRLSIEEAYNRELPAVRTLLRQLGFNVNHNKLLGLIQHAFTLNSHTLVLLALAAAAYAVLEIIEGVGLWLLKRWGEYFAMVVTSVFLPYEIYDLTAKVTVLRLLAFLVNLALVIYLVLAKRLFGVRGGKKAYEAMLHSESILQNEIDALEAGRSAAAAGAPAPAVSPAPDATAATDTTPAPDGAAATESTPARDAATESSPARDASTAVVSADGLASAEAPAPPSDDRRS
jgi:uncharacterized membrane protein (DUF2068 family)